MLKTKTVIRAVSYGDIEYSHWVDGKNIIFLKDNETEESRESIKKMKKGFQKHISMIV